MKKFKDTINEEVMRYFFKDGKYYFATNNKLGDDFKNLKNVIEYSRKEWMEAKKDWKESVGNLSNFSTEITPKTIKDLI